MPTTVTSKIGATNSPVTMDYTTLQAWEDACPANLVTDDKIWRGECYDQGTFATSSTTTIAGTTTDATRKIELVCATGASFREKSGALTNPLKYNSSGGVALEFSTGYSYALLIQVNNVLVQGLQIKNTASGGYVVSTSTFSNIIIDSCIITNGGVFGSYLLSLSGGIAKNCLCIANASFSTVRGVEVHAGGSLIGCTIVRMSNVGAGTTGIYQFFSPTPTVKNCAVFGFTNDTSGTFTSSYNATDDTSPTSGFTGSLTFTSQFEGTTSSAPDFRAKATGSLDLNGTPDSTNTPTDIVGQTRHATTPTIGAWEVVASGLKTLCKFVFQSINRANNY